jgi:hypothetical protein
VIHCSSIPPRRALGHARTRPGAKFLILRRSIIFLFFYSLVSCKPDGVEPDFQREGWRDTIGWVTGVASNRFIHYSVRGKYYKARFYRSIYGDASEDEKYKLSFNTKDPSEIEICYSCPVFLAEEHVISTVGSLKKIRNARWPFDKEYTALFRYTIQGVEFEREQILPDDFELLYPDLQEGRIYEVVVWTKQVQRAILQADKQINRDAVNGVNSGL